jgi:hypothetical protein
MGQEVSQMFTIRQHDSFDQGKWVGHTDNPQNEKER